MAKSTMKKFTLLSFFLFLMLSQVVSVYAQQSVKSNPVNTKVGAPAGPPPGGGGTRPTPPPAPSSLRQAIIDQFGVTMNGFSEIQLGWAWEKLWDVSKTNFPALVKGSVVTAGAGTSSEQTGCKNVIVGSAFNSPELFKIIFTHELGHVIYWCTGEQAHRSGHASAFASEGGVTGYGNSGCLGTPAVTEDYAEMIAYYLNRDATEQTARCSNRGQVPFSDGKYPVHFTTAQSVLGVY